MISDHIIVIVIVRDDDGIRRCNGNCSHDVLGSTLSSLFPETGLRTVWLVRVFSSEWYRERLHMGVGHVWIHGMHSSVVVVVVHTGEICNHCSGWSTLRWQAMRMKRSRMGEQLGMLLVNLRIVCLCGRRNTITLVVIGTPPGLYVSTEALVERDGFCELTLQSSST